MLIYISPKVKASFNLLLVDGIATVLVTRFGSGVAVACSNPGWGKPEQPTAGRIRQISARRRDIKMTEPSGDFVITR